MMSYWSAARGHQTLRHGWELNKSYQDIILG